MIRVYSFAKVENDWRDRYIQLSSRLIPLQWKEIPIKRLPNERPPQLLPEESKLLSQLQEREFYLLDSNGKLMNSNEFYSWCFKESERILIVGPAFGFHPDFLKNAKGKISLSPLTFTHSLAQLMLAESLYRSACILKNHPFVK